MGPSSLSVRQLSRRYCAVWATTGPVQLVVRSRVVVVHHHELVVRRQLQVELEDVRLVRGVLHGGQGVLRDPGNPSTPMPQDRRGGRRWRRLRDGRSWCRLRAGRGGAAARATRFQVRWSTRPVTRRWCRSWNRLTARAVVRVYRLFTARGPSRCSLCSRVSRSLTAGPVLPRCRLRVVASAGAATHAGKLHTSATTHNPQCAQEASHPRPSPILWIPRRRPV